MFRKVAYENSDYSSLLVDIRNKLHIHKTQNLTLPMPKYIITFKDVFVCWGNGPSTARVI